MQRVVIVHGVNASPTSHWFAWLAEQAAAAGAEVSTPALPDSAAPDPEAWTWALREAMGTVDEDLVVVAHSLGCIAVLRALASELPVRLGGLVLVSPFMDPLPNLPELDAFTEDLPDVRHILADTPVTIIASDDDEIVEPVYTVWFAEVMGEPVHVVEGAGHFLGGDGWNELPAARDAVLAALA